MQRIILGLAFVSLAAVVSTAATAGGSCSSRDGASVVQHIFDMADTDKDGELSLAEYDAADLGRYGVTFVETDRDGNGTTSLDEYLDLYLRIHTNEEELKV